MQMLKKEEISQILAGQVNEKIERLESVMLEQEQVDVPVKHKFINGMYAREILIPKGTLLTGRVHKYAYLDIMVRGDITVATPEGTKRVTGYNVMDGQPGRKRAGYAHEDTLWITVHRTDHVDPESIMEKLTFFSMAEYKSFQLDVDRKDYEQLLLDFDISQDQIEAQVNQENMIELPEQYENDVFVSESVLHDLGLFANREFKEGDHIIPAQIAGYRTVGLRYSNHSTQPNGKMILLDNGDIALVAVKPIEKGCEITTNYRAAIVSVSRGLECQ